MLMFVEDSRQKLLCCLGIQSMTWRLTAAANTVSEVDRQDVAGLLNHVAILHKASDVLLEKLESETQNCLTQSREMMELSHRIRDSLSVILGSAWMLEMHGENLDSEKLLRHCSIIRERIIRLLDEIELAGPWPELDLKLQP